MQVRSLLNKVLIVGSACLRVNNEKKSNKNCKRVLIVFQQIYGDAIVFEGALREYSKIFPIEKGYSITLLVRPSVKLFMEATLDIPDEISIELVDFKRYVEDYAYYKEITKKYDGFAELMIVPGSSLSAEIFASSCSSKAKIALVGSMPVKGPLYRIVFYNKAYTGKIVPPKEEMMLQRHRRLLHYLGDSLYEARLPLLLPKEKIIKEDNYCVLCPGSSKTEKCWPVERFADVADYIIEKYGMPVHLCGGPDEKKFSSLICASVVHKNKVISHIGDTNFSDWSAIVQHAALVIGNDSATMHLAAASRRKSICIAGVYDKYQFFPYQVDRLERGDTLPVTLIRDMPCEWCRTRGYHAGFGNAVCSARIANAECVCCIDLITVRDVEIQIDKLLGMPVNEEKSK